MSTSFDSQPSNELRGRQPKLRGLIVSVAIGGGAALALGVGIMWLQQHTTDACVAAECQDAVVQAFRHLKTGEIIDRYGAFLSLEGTGYRRAYPVLPGSGPPWLAIDRTGRFEKGQANVCIFVYYGYQVEVTRFDVEPATNRILVNVSHPEFR
jgi:hypothetical protein